MSQKVQLTNPPARSKAREGARFRLRTYDKLVCILIGDNSQRWRRYEAATISIFLYHGGLPSLHYGGLP